MLASIRLLNHRLGHHLPLIFGDVFSTVRVHSLRQGRHIPRRCRRALRIRALPTATTRHRHMDSRVCAPHFIHRYGHQAHVTECSATTSCTQGCHKQSPTPLSWLLLLAGGIRSLSVSALERYHWVSLLPPSRPHECYSCMCVRSSDAGAKYHREHRLDDAGAVALPFCRFQCRGPEELVAYDLQALQESLPLPRFHGASGGIAIADTDRKAWTRESQDEHAGGMNAGRGGAG
ncbi:hypothetical protein HDV57DRAFT_495874 [Trichoderma longibrachiatum]|uniref:Uncharacterized protein n=1 Tax=Trichoderma longibrachiatum ATCC 18648 TaxID=983965 RepID=A0A2T4C0E3_TRILO|nr:hypothetical protein M440DRAFT_1267631 [Trichoderma longibrachiatum ATCC 18648]